jgi:hypothetical protein
MAVDLITPSPLVQETIKKLLELLDSRLHIVHIVQEEEEVTDLKNILPELHPEIDLIKDKDFVPGMQRYISGDNIDLLVVLPHKHSMVERLFFKTHTVELVDDLNIPILSIQ